MSSTRSPAVRSKAVAIGLLNVRRFARDRTNIFFVFVFPVAIVLLIGVQFSGTDDARLGVVGGSGTGNEALIDEIERSDDIELVDVDDEGTLVDRVEAGDLDAGIVLTEPLSSGIDEGPPVEVGFVAGNTEAGQQMGTVVERALARVMAVPEAARLAVERGADPEAAAEAAARLAAGALDRVQVETITTGEELFPEDIGQFAVAAPSQLVLFTFITGLTGAYALIQSRQLGISARMMSTPTSVRSIIFGEALGRFLIGLIQSVYILLGTLVVFGVDWGDPLGAAALVLAVSAVSAGAAMCFGTVFSNPEQASGLGVVTALGLGAMGGAMLPIELFSETLARVAQVTPHYWALDGFAELIRHDGTILDIGGQLAVLATMALALLLLASWRMRVVLTRGG